MTQLRASLKVAAIASLIATGGFTLVSFAWREGRNSGPPLDTVSLLAYTAFLVFCAALALGWGAHLVLRLLHRASRGAYVLAGSLLGGSAAIAVFLTRETLLWSLAVAFAFSAAGGAAAWTFWRSQVQHARPPDRPGA